MGPLYIKLAHAFQGKALPSKIGALTIPKHRGSTILDEICGDAQLVELAHITGKNIDEFLPTLMYNIILSCHAGGNLDGYVKYPSILQKTIV